MPTRGRADAGSSFGVDAVGREVLEYLAVGSEDSYRRVLRADHLRRDLGHARKDPFVGNLGDHYRTGHLELLEALLNRRSVGDHGRGHNRKMAASKDFLSSQIFLPYARFLHERSAALRRK